jgi:hypothetical protein
MCRLHVQQAGGMAAVQSVAVRTSGSSGTFQPLTNKWGSDWETSNAPAFPLDITIVGADGESVSACCPVMPCLLASAIS